MYISKHTPNFHFNFLTITYSITCELNGGSATNEAAYTIESEDIVLNNPTKTGYTFLGWSGTDIDGMSTNVVIPSGSVGNRAYVAHWEIVIYTIKYELNSGSSSNITMYTIESDVITLNNPTRIGYTFLGWSGTDIEDMSANVVISSGSTGNREYTANWMAIFYCGSNSITGLTNHGKTLEYILIPSSIDGRAIRRIDERAFDSCTNLKSVVIEDGVESIGEYAFRNCSSLTSVVIGNNVTNIGESAFYLCDSLTTIVIPNSVTSISDGAFPSCDSLVYKKKMD